MTMGCNRGTNLEHLSHSVIVAVVVEQLQGVKEVRGQHSSRGVKLDLHPHPQRCEVLVPHVIHATLQLQAACTKSNAVMYKLWPGLKSENSTNTARVCMSIQWWAFIFCTAASISACDVFITCSKAHDRVRGEHDTPPSDAPRLAIPC